MRKMMECIVICGLLSAMGCSACMVPLLACQGDEDCAADSTCLEGSCLPGDGPGPIEDAGEPDAGGMDAGIVTDSGTSDDAGLPGDAGQAEDAGGPDAGFPDAGIQLDAGPDAGIIGEDDPNLVLPEDPDSDGHASAVCLHEAGFLTFDEGRDDRLFRGNPAYALGTGPNLPGESQRDDTQLFPSVGRFCWDFSSEDPGTYEFRLVSSCEINSGATCDPAPLSLSDPGNWALYQLYEFCKVGRPICHRDVSNPTLFRLRVTWDGLDLIPSGNGLPAPGY